MERIAEASPLFKARIAGGFYLLTILTGGFAVFVRGRLVVYDDLATTVANIQVHEPLFRFGFAADLIAGACYIAVTALFYALLKPVNRRLSVVGVFITFVGCAIGAQADQLQALVGLYTGRYDVRVAVGLMCLGLGSTVFSYLWFKSRYIPGALVAWGVFSSLLVSTGSFAFIIFHSFGNIFFPGYLAPIFIFEVTMGSWLLLKGLQLPGIPEPDRASS